MNHLKWDSVFVQSMTVESSLKDCSTNQLHGFSNVAPLGNKPGCSAHSVTVLQLKIILSHFCPGLDFNWAIWGYFHSLKLSNNKIILVKILLMAKFCSKSGSALLGLSQEFSEILKLILFHLSILNANRAQCSKCSLNAVSGIKIKTSKTTISQWAKAEGTG